MEGHHALTDGLKKASKEEVKVQCLSFSVRMVTGCNPSLYHLSSLKGKKRRMTEEYECVHSSIWELF